MLKSEDGAGALSVSALSVGHAGGSRNGRRGRAPSAVRRGLFFLHRSKMSGTPPVAVNEHLLEVPEASPRLRSSTPRRGRVTGSLDIFPEVRHVSVVGGVPAPHCVLR
jgi:hypothetical protein